MYGCRGHRYASGHGRGRGDRQARAARRRRGARRALWGATRGRDGDLAHRHRPDGRAPTRARELATTIVSTIRAARDIAIGNLIGSGTYNLTLILGVTVLVRPITVDPELVLIDIPVMIAATFLTGLFMMSGHRVSRRMEGTIMVVLYGGYLAHLLATRL
ncbi:MAG: hypothetical protein QM622_11450 [Microbacterium sp.]